MVAESGAVLLDDEARTALVERLLPLATVVTPNIPEARALTGAGEDASQEDLARAVLALGPEAVVVTGGHSEQVVDVFFDGARGGRDRRASATPTAPPTAPAARTPRRWPPSSPAASRRWRRRARRARSPRRRSPPACARSAQGPARSTSSTSPASWRTRSQIEVRRASPVDSLHELQRHHHDRPAASPLQRRLRRPRPRRTPAPT